MTVMQDVRYATHVRGRPALFLTVAVTAIGLPERRALRVDPHDLLRQE